MIRCSLVLSALLPLLAVGCADAGAPDESDTEEAALTSVRTVHQGPVTLLGAHRYRVLYTVETPAGREVRYVASTGGEKTLATLPATESVSATESEPGVFLLRHGELGPSALAIVDLRPSVARYVDAVPAKVAQRAVLRGGNILYTTQAAGALEVNLFVRTAAGAVVQAPGTAQVMRHELSPDGQRVAYWRAGELTAFEVATGAAVTLPVEAASRFQFVGPDLLYSEDRTGDFWRVRAAGKERFYTTPVRASEVEWFVRPDGKLLVAAHTASRPEWTHMELVDAQTGEGTYFPRARGAVAPHYETFRHVVSEDGRFLLDWYPTRGNVGDVWLHDLASTSEVASTKLASGVTVGWLRDGRYGVTGGSSLGRRCAFEGAFVYCTKDEADATGTLFSRSAPSKGVARPRGLATHGADAACFVTNDAVSCLGKDGNLVSSAADLARNVRGGDAWFGARVAIEEGAGRLALHDPRTGAREKVLEHACAPGSFEVATTVQRLFVADCTGLHIAR